MAIRLNPSDADLWHKPIFQLISVNNYLRFHWNMPRGLKETSSQIVISFGLAESAANTFTSERIDLQLNALDNEVFVVTGVKLDALPPDVQLGLGDNRTETQATLSKQDITNALAKDLSNPSVFAAHTVNIITSGAVLPVSGDYAYNSVLQSEGLADAPYHVEYLDIIATPDFYVNIMGQGNASPRSVNGKLYGYRARADASTYAALVQSELLSQ